MVIKTERFEMRLDPEILERIDAWRGGEEDVPSRAEAVRRLIDLGLNARSQKGVTITDGEKILVLMLGDLLKHLKVDADLDPKFLASAIHGGHLWALGWQYSGLFHGHEDHKAVVTEVTDILDMWFFLESGYAALSKKDKERVEKEASPFGKNVKFPGFDGNNEGEHYGIARFLTEDMDRFSSVKAVNSHLPTLDGYRRMLKLWEPTRKTLTGGELSAPQIIALLNARRHPDRAAPGKSAPPTA